MPSAPRPRNQISAIRMTGYLGTLELLGQITALANTIPLTSRAMQAPTQASISDGSDTALSTR